MMDVQEKLEGRGIVHFHRGSVLCALSKTQGHVGTNMGTYWGHIGVDKRSPLYGSIFHKAGNVRLYRVTMAQTGNAAIDKRWWMGFEGTRAHSFDGTLDELKRAADAVNDVDRAAMNSSV